MGSTTENFDACLSLQYTAAIFNDFQVPNILFTILNFKLKYTHHQRRNKEIRR